MRRLILGFALLLAACGGGSSPESATCSHFLTLSPWASCPASGVQTRNVIVFTESIPGCTALPALSQSCTPVAAGLSCPATDPHLCSFGAGPAACCPSDRPLYCRTANEPGNPSTCMSANAAATPSVCAGDLVTCE